MTQVPENIKRKMAALRRMAQDSSSENEAMIAATMLYKLVAKYGDEGMELEFDGFAPGTEVIIIDSKMLAPWAGIVAQAVARLYFCTVTQTPTKPGPDGKKCREFGIHGANNYRSTARFMAETILRVVHEAACQSSKEASAAGIYAGRGHIISFRNGAAHRISQRCYKLINEAKKGEMCDDEGRRLPAMLNLYTQEEQRIQEYLKKLYGKLRTEKVNMNANDREAAAKGAAFGDSVRLHQELAESAKLNLLG